MISRLHYITQDMLDLSHAQLAEHACKGGADWVQLRVKNKSYSDWLKIAQEVKLVCLHYNAKLIINDNVKIAQEINADGVHLGKDDMNPLEARRILGEKSIIGGSTNTFEDVKRQIKNKCNYIGLGPFKFTSTKEKLNPVLGLEGIKKIAEEFAGKIPIIAIGGITKEDIQPLLKTGVYGIAVSSTINLSAHQANTTQNILSEILSMKS